jgi:hypothetical protein
MDLGVHLDSLSTFSPSDPRGEMWRTLWGAQLERPMERYSHEVARARLCNHALNHRMRRCKYANIEEQGSYKLYRLDNMCSRLASEQAVFAVNESLYSLLHVSVDSAGKSSALHSPKPTPSPHFPVNCTTTPSERKPRCTAGGGRLCSSKHPRPSSESSDTVPQASKSPAWKPQPALPWCASSCSKDHARTLLFATQARVTSFSGD